MDSEHIPPEPQIAQAIATMTVAGELLLEVDNPPTANDRWMCRQLIAAARQIEREALRWADGWDQVAIPADVEWRVLVCKLAAYAVVAEALQNRRWGMTAMHRRRGRWTQRYDARIRAIRDRVDRCACRIRNLLRNSAKAPDVQACSQVHVFKAILLLQKFLRQEHADSDFDAVLGPLVRTYARMACGDPIPRYLSLGWLLLAGDLITDPPADDSEGPPQPIAQDPGAVPGEISLRERAILLLRNNPTLSMRAAARQLGCNHTTLSKDPELRRIFRAAQSLGAGAVPRGRKTADGDVEAYE